MAMGQWRNNDEDQSLQLIFTNDDTEIDQTNMGYNGSAISSVWSASLVNNCVVVVPVLGTVVVLYINCSYVDAIVFPVN